MVKLTVYSFRILVRKRGQFLHQLDLQPSSCERRLSIRVVSNLVLVSLRKFRFGEFDAFFLFIAVSDESSLDARKTSVGVSFDGVDEMTPNWFDI